MEVKPGYKQTEVGVIPEEWGFLPFNSIGTVIDGDRGVNYPSDQEFSDYGYCLFLNAGNVTKNGFKFDECAFITREKDRKLSKGKLKRQDIVLTTRGTVGNFAYFDASVPFDKLRINSGMVILRSESPAIVPKFLYALLQSHPVGKQIERLSFGSAQPQLTVKGISRLGIIVPPIPEQQAIVEVRSGVDALLRALDRLIAKKRDLKQAAMQQLLTGQTRLPGFTGEWAMKTLESLCSMKSGEGITSFRINEQSGFPCYGGNGLRGYTSRWTHNGKFVLIGRVGALCGNVRSAEGKFFASEHAIVATPHSVVDQGWLCVVLDRMRLNQYSESSAQPVLTVSKLLKLECIVPPSKAEQSAIAEVLSDMDAEIAALEQRREKTQALKQAMMQELLTGKTRLVTPEAAHA
jgi:type I restriction enzyme S subunit